MARRWKPSIISASLLDLAYAVEVIAEQLREKKSTEGVKHGNALLRKPHAGVGRASKRR